MSGRRLVELDRPEAGAERDVLWIVPHKCNDSYIERALGNPVNDELMFPVGLAGWEMPEGVPFEVQSGNLCGACGKAVRMWAQWRKRLILV